MKKLFFAIAILIAFASCTTKSVDNNTVTTTVDTLAVDTLTVDTVNADTIVVE